MYKNFLNKKDGWTLIELIVCVTIIILISSFLISNFKPASQKAKFFLYATIKNLGIANASVVDKMSTLELPDVGSNDGYCMQLADSFSSNASNCDKTSTKYIPNLTLANGVTIMGLASPWNLPFPSADYKYKDILIDVDGSKGPNKIWLDRFPFRIYNDTTRTGVIFPVNCGTEYDKFYDDAGNALNPTVTNPYCTGKREFLKEDKIISYDVFRSDKTVDDLTDDEYEAGKGVGAELKKGLVSPLVADCEAFGGTGMFNVYQCAAAGIKVLPECTTYEICEIADKAGKIANITTASDLAGCQGIADGSNSTPAADGSKIYGLCFTMMHKPTGGINIMLNSVLDEVDM